MKMFTTYNKYFYGVKGVYPTAQIVAIPQAIQKIPGRKSNATNEIVFRASNIPPLGILAYAIANKTEENVAKQPQSTNFISNEVNRSIYKYIIYNKLLGAKI